jgi:hypothetical protein
MKFMYDQRKDNIANTVFFIIIIHIFVILAGCVIIGQDHKQKDLPAKQLNNCSEINKTISTDEISSDQLVPPTLVNTEPIIENNDSTNNVASTTNNNSTIDFNLYNFVILFGFIIALGLIIIVLRYAANCSIDETYTPYDPFIGDKDNKYAKTKSPDAIKSKPSDTRSSYMTKKDGLWRIIINNELWVTVNSGLLHLSLFENISKMVIGNITFDVVYNKHFIRIEYNGKYESTSYPLTIENLETYLAKLYKPYLEKEIKKFNVLLEYKNKEVISTEDVLKYMENPV